MMPVSTSPLPPVAMPGLPVWLMLYARAVGDDGVVALEHDDDSVCFDSQSRLRDSKSSAAASIRSLRFVVWLAGEALRIRRGAASARAGRRLLESASGRSASANNASASTTIGLLISRYRLLDEVGERRQSGQDQDRARRRSRLGRHCDYVAGG